LFKKKTQILIVHSQSIDCLGGAELSLQSHIRSAPADINIDIVTPDTPVALKNYDTVILANLRPSGGFGDKSEYNWALQWIAHLKGYRGYLIRLERDVHPCAYRDARGINFEKVKCGTCSCASLIPQVFQTLYNLCDAVIFLSPLHKQVINQIINIKVRRQYDIAVPLDLSLFRTITPFKQRKHAALIIGDAIRVSPEAVSLAAKEGYPVEYMDYLSVPYNKMPGLLNQYQAIVVAPVMLHAFGRLVVEAMACGCHVITNNRVGALSYSDPVAACQKSNDAFWRIVTRRPRTPNWRRFLLLNGLNMMKLKHQLGKWLKPIYIYRKRLSELRREKSFSIRQERLLYSCLLNEKKRKNLAKISLGNRFRKYIEWTRPHILHVGVTTHCNLRCTACPTGTESLGRATKHLDFDLYCQTVDSLRDSLLFMLFWDWGEPLLHPRLAEMIRHAGKSGIRTVISTHGSLKYTDKKIEELVLAQPDTVIVCVDGADQETYQTYRKGGQLSKVLQTIKQLVKTKERLGKSLPLIEFRSLATKGTEQQMPELLKLAQETGADLFSVKTLRPFDFRGSDVDENLVPDNESLSRYEYAGDKPIAATRKTNNLSGQLDCGKPLHAPTLNADGTLAFCSYAQYEDEFFGTLINKSFDAVWKGPLSRSRRIDFLESGGGKSCEDCYFRFEPMPTIIHQVILRPLPDGITAEAPQSIESFLSLFPISK
jgi:MoaA/NifB/PqqE/SkfB family radical SAM enzyme